ncbi:GNAT family N-acetyltransferase [Tistrella bauzanensis]|jgi:GNAT superfamily N-acetyltransferase|uniref:GNAT family N-acetyltransferase n=1 Tax=Tistrella arctica TaxID=3133430 RepID=A0ABU9YS77_9PROT
MAPIDAAPPKVGRIGPDHIAGCLDLSGQAGWNQTAADWSVFFDAGTVFAIAGEDGALLATGAVLPHGPDIAWISMVLVRAAQRGRGLGTHILNACLNHCRAAGLLPVLDATPAGERVYRPLGFLPWFGLTRWQGQGGGDVRGAAGRCRPATADDLPAILALDTQALGAARATLLGRLAGSGTPGFVHGDGTGFVLSRPGRTATQIGPLVATNDAAAADLLNAACAAIDGPVIIDLADHHTALGQHLGAQRFMPSRPFLRMACGHPVPIGTSGRLFAAAGPEFG